MENSKLGSKVSWLLSNSCQGRIACDRVFWLPSTMFHSRPPIMPSQMLQGGNWESAQVVDNIWFSFLKGNSSERLGFGVPGWGVLGAGPYSSKLWNRKNWSSIWEAESKSQVNHLTSDFQDNGLQPTGRPQASCWCSINWSQNIHLFFDF